MMPSLNILSSCSSIMFFFKCDALYALLFTGTIFGDAVLHHSGLTPCTGGDKQPCLSHWEEDAGCCQARKYWFRW